MYRFIFALVCFAASCEASVITTSATCSLPGQSVTTATGNCDLRSHPNDISLQATSQFSFSATLGTDFAVSLFSDLTTNARPPSVAPDQTYSTISFEYQIRLATTGTLRPGFFAFAASGVGSRSDFGASATLFAVDGDGHTAYFPDTLQFPQTTTGPGTPYANGNLSGKLFQVMLGDGGDTMTFDITLEAQSTARAGFSGFDLNSAGVEMFARLDLLAFEADMTPVNLIEAAATPEPTTRVLGLAGIVLIAWRKIRSAALPRS